MFLASANAVIYSFCTFLFRRKLDLFANVVHVNSLPGYSTRHNNLDLVIIREQTEGEYSSLEHEVNSCPNLINKSNIFFFEKHFFKFCHLK